MLSPTLAANSLCALSLSHFLPTVPKKSVAASLARLQMWPNHSAGKLQAGKVSRSSLSLSSSCVASSRAPNLLAPRALRILQHEHRIEPNLTEPSATSACAC